MVVCPSMGRLPGGRALGTDPADYETFRLGNNNSGAAGNRLLHLQPCKELEERKQPPGTG